MELNDANLQTLTEFLRKTLDPDPTVRRPGKTTLKHGIPMLHMLAQYMKCIVCNTCYFLSAEKFLESVEGNQNYSLLLLTLLEKSQDNVIRVCAAVTFKNYIKRNWRIVSLTK